MYVYTRTGSPFSKDSEAKPFSGKRMKQQTKEKKMPTEEEEAEKAERLAGK